jgi:hypothetical protein
MPANEAIVTLYAPDDRTAARAVAIGVIIFLMVCLKGSPTVGSVLTGVVGSGLTYGLNRWVKGKEPELISAYGVMIAVLVLTLILPASLVGTQLYDSIDSLLEASHIGRITSVTPVLFATPIAFVLWCIKAWFWDQNKIRPKVVGWAAQTAVIVAFIVAVVAWLPTSFLSGSGA